MYIKTTIFSLAICYSASIYTKSRPSTINKSTPVLQIKNTQNEFKVARYFDQFYRDIRRGKLNGTSVKGIFRYNTKVSTFHPLNHEIKRAYLIYNKTNTLGQLHHACFKHTPLTTTHPIEFELKKYIDKYCRTRLLKLLVRKKYSSKIRDKYLASLKISLPFYLKGESPKLFSKYLSKIDKKSSLYKLMSDLVNETYLLNSIGPSPKVLAHIAISKKLSELIQKKGIKNINSTSIFTREFRIIEWSGIFRALPILFSETFVWDLTNSIFNIFKEEKRKNTTPP